MKIGQVDYKKKLVKPEISLCKPNREIIDVINTAYDIELDLQLGVISELSFRVPIFVEKHHSIIKNRTADLLKGRLHINLVLGGSEEYFIITQINKSGSGNDEHMEVQCFSLGYELNDRIIREYNVVGRNCTSILNDILNDTLWSIGYIDSDFDLQYRSFEISSNTSLECVVELAKTFNAIVQYDTINRKINFYKPQNIGDYKGFTIGYGRYLESINQEENSEEVITRLRMYGKEGVSIQNITPTGTTYVEDLSYYKYPYEDVVTETVEQVQYTKNWYDTNYTVNGNNISINSVGMNVDINVISNNRYSNYTLTGLLSTASNTIDSSLGFVFNYNNKDDFYYIDYKRTANENDTSMFMYHYSNGIHKEIAKSSNIQRWSSGIKHTFELEMINGIVNLKIDNTIVISYEIKKYVDGNIGLYSRNNVINFEDLIFTTINIDVINRSDYMTNELAYFENKYKRILESNNDEFNRLVAYRANYYEQLGILDDELQALNNQYKIILDERDILNTRIARMQDGKDKASNANQPQDFYQDSLQDLTNRRDLKLIEKAEKERELDAKKSEIAIVEANFDALMHQIDIHRNKISLENNFPARTRMERRAFEIEKDWTETNIESPELLYEEGLKVFDEYRKAKITASIDIVNFFSMIEEQINWDKLNLGDEFDIEYERLDLLYSAKVTGLKFNFENDSIDVTISNVQDIYSHKDKWLEMIYNSNKVSSSVQMKEWEWDLSLENNGSINEIINNMWDANKQSIIGAKDQVVEISDRGLIIRDENDPQKYLVAINGMLALTNDGGDTFKHAITTEGIVGERIYGKIIMGMNLAIEDESGILTIQGSKGKVFNRTGDLRMHFGLVEENGLCGEAFGLISENEITQVKVTDCEGFVISRKNPSEQDYPTGWEKVFWTTIDGTIYGHDLVVSNIKVVSNKDWQSLILDSELGFFDIGWFSKIVKDGKLTTDEKLNLITELRRISSSYMEILKQAEKYKYVTRDDTINFNSAYNGTDFDRVKSTEAKLSTTPIETAYLNLVDFMSSYIRVTSVNPHKPVEILTEDAMTETTSDLGANRENLILMFKNYYDEYDKLRHLIEDIIVYQGISMGENYNNVYIGEHGLVVVRNDKIYRAYLNATNGLALQKWENGVWVSKLFATLGDPMWDDGTLVAEGLVAKNLRIVDANMNDKITFDWYDGITVYGDSNTVYLNANDSFKITDLAGDAKFWVDMNGFLYAKDITTHNLKIVDGELGDKITFDQDDGISIYGDYADIFLNANDAIRIKTKNGEDRFWVDTDGFLYAKKLYIMGDDDKMIEDIDGSYISDLTVNRLKTLGRGATQQDIVHIEDNFVKFNTWFKDREFTKLKMEFEGTGQSSYPVMTFGAGNGRDYGTGANQAKMYKTDELWMFEYDRLESWGSKSKLVFNSTNTDNHGQAIYMRSKGGIRLESEDRVVMKCVGVENADGSSQALATEAYIRVGVETGERNASMKFGDGYISIHDNGILIKWDDNNYIQLSSSGVTIKGSRIDLN